jgi:hypothetical protein
VIFNLPQREAIRLADWLEVNFKRGEVQFVTSRMMKPRAWVVRIERTL